jgi:hypothetical protein
MIPGFRTAIPRLRSLLPPPPAHPGPSNSRSPHPASLGSYDLGSRHSDFRSPHFPSLSHLCFPRPTSSSTRHSCYKCLGPYISFLLKVWLKCQDSPCNSALPLLHSRPEFLPPRWHQTHIMTHVPMSVSLQAPKDHASGSLGPGTQWLGQALRNCGGEGDKPERT